MIVPMRSATPYFRGQERRGRVDRGLHFLLRRERLFEREAERDHRRAAGARRGHLIEARQLAELAFERRRDGAGHDLRARARIEGEDPDRRIVDLRQADTGSRRYDQAREQQRRHQERRGDRPLDERA